jgi:hypothetical protein
VTSLPLSNSTNDRLPGSLPHQRLPVLARFFGQDAKRPRRLAERAVVLENVGEGVPLGLDRQGLAAAR